jgi:hypothetical protein
VKREQILTEAIRLTSTDRMEIYGEPLVNHQRIARLWQVILGTEISPAEVALCMVAVKIARLVETPNDADSFVDGAAYFAIAGELSNTLAG